MYSNHHALHSNTVSFVRVVRGSLRIDFQKIYAKWNLLGNMKKMRPTATFYDQPFKSSLFWEEEKPWKLQIWVLLYFYCKSFLKMGNFWTVDGRRSRLVSVSLSFQGDSILHKFFEKRFSGSPVRPKQSGIWRNKLLERSD